MMGDCNARREHRNALLHSSLQYFHTITVFLRIFDKKSLNQDKLVRE